MPYSAANLNTIPELDKVGHVIREMSKLNSQQLNLWIMRYESENATVASKQFAPFSAALTVAYNNIDATTLKDAGYTAAQAKETANLIAQVQMLSAQVEALQQAAHTRVKRNRNTLEAPATPAAPAAAVAQQETSRGAGRSHHPKNSATHAGSIARIGARRVENLNKFIASMPKRNDGAALH